MIAGGVSFSDVVRVYETSAPRSRRQGVRVASGVGLILAEEGLDANRLNPELTSGIDNCRARALVPQLLLGLPLVAAWRRKAR